MTRSYVKSLAVIASFLTLAASRAPASTPIDLTTAGATRTLTAPNGGDFIVQQTSIKSTTTEVLDSFVRIRARGGGTSEEGYNTGASTLQFETRAARSLLLSEVPVVNIGGTDYRQFVLNIRQWGWGSERKLSLNQVQIFLSQSNELTDAVHLFDATATAPPVIGFLVPNTTEVFRMNDSESDFNEILLKDALNKPRKKSDMFLYVRDAAFQAVVGPDPLQQYVYLYSQFGTSPGAYPTNGGAESWAVLKSKTPPNPVPEPSTVALALTGLGALGFAGLGRHRRT